MKRQILDRSNLVRAFLSRLKAELDASKHAAARLLVMSSRSISAVPRSGNIIDFVESNVARHSSYFWGL
jgi:hypothetical protein